MKKATNIKELTENLNPLQPLSKEDENVYVPIYDNILDSLRDMIINEQLPNQTFFVTGQEGTGKSTALNFLPDDSITNKFEIKYIRGRDLFEPSDIDIIDLLLIFAHELVKDNDSLKNQYYKELNKLQQVHEGSLIQETSKDEGRTASLGIGAILNFGINLFANYKIEGEYRKRTREIFKLKKQTLVDKINDIIDKYSEHVSKGKPLLVIIDDLEKLKNPQQIHDLFIENKFYILKLKCIKVIPIPVHLTSLPTITELSSESKIERFELRLSSNPLDSDYLNEPENQIKDEEKIEQNKKTLIEIVTSRIDNNANLIDTDATNEAINQSGGILKQYIQILHGAAVKARRWGTKISKDDVSESWHSIRDTYARTLLASSKTIELLAAIKSKHIAPSNSTEQELINALLTNQVLSYSNGTPWYEINPLLKIPVEIYAKKLHESQ